MTKQERQELQDFIADACEKAKSGVKGGSKYKATMILRAPHLPDGDVIVTEDDAAEVIAVIRKRFPEVSHV